MLPQIFPTMDKHDTDIPTEANHVESVEDDIKIEPQSATAMKDVSLGEMLDVDATPQQEKKVLLKLDIMYVLPGFLEIAY